LIFVNVNPAQATADAPKDAKYYSDKNSRAANPEPDRITEAPKINGKQTEVVKTEDIPREKFTPLQPSRPAQQPQEPQTEIKPKPAYTPGDLTLAKPSPTLRKTEGDANEAKPPRPRTIREALARQQDSRLPGEKMKQEGGVNRHAEISSVDTKATPFGAYDAALVEAISQRWFTLLREYGYASDSVGKVVLQFHLHYDGRITDMNMGDNTAGEMLGLLCEKAVLDPAPFAVWPSDMRRTLGNTRNIQFTFYYRID
jgi:outer membrane biosynthesis protein TonB